MRFSPRYLQYIISPEWRARRRHAIARAGGRCQACGESRRLQVHHVTYENLGAERDEDLTVLCAYCHAWLTFAIRLRRWARRFAEWVRRQFMKFTV